MTRIPSTPWFIRARLRTRHLQLLTAIGEEGNIHRAAAMLNMSQPAASRLLGDLEEIIGAELFDRLPRGVRANWYGETLIRHARNALASLNAAASEIDLLKSGRRGLVTLGTTAGAAVSIVPRAIARVVRDNPMVRVQVELESSTRLLERLQEGSLDLMVGRLNDRDSRASFSYERLADEPACVIARRDHPLMASADLDLRELAEAPWIVPPSGSMLRQRFELLFREAGLSFPKRIIEAAAPLIVSRLVEETHYLAVVSRVVANCLTPLGTVALMPGRLECHLDSFGIVLRKEGILSPAASLLQSALRAEATRGWGAEVSEAPLGGNALASNHSPNSHEIAWAPSA